MKIKEPRMLLVALIHFTLTLYGDSLVFTEPRNALYYWTKLFVFGFLIWLWQKTPGWINALKTGQISIYARAAGIYFLINFIIFLLVWPGMWTPKGWVCIAYHVKLFSFCYWYHIVTNLFYLISLELIPHLTGVVLIQIILISLIAGYTVSNFHKLYPSKYTLWLLLPFCLPMILANNFYPARLYLYTYLLLFFFLNVIFKYLGREKPLLKDIIIWGISGALLVSWRSEGIIYLTGIPVLLGVLFYKQLNLKKIFTFFLIFCGLSYAVNVSQEKDTDYFYKYKFVSYNFPVNFIIKSTKVSPHDLQVINEVIDTSFPGPADEAIKQDISKEKMRKFEITLGKLILRNFPLIFGVMARDYRKNSYASLSTYNADGEDENLLTISKPFNDTLRRKTMELLLLQSFDNSHVKLPGYKVFYNIYIPVGFLLIFFIAGVIKRNFLFLIISTLLLCNLTIVILFAPEPSLTYLQGIYTCAYAFMAMFLLKLRCDKS